MRKITIFSLLIVCIVIVFVAGCANSTSSSTTTTTPVSTSVPVDTTAQVTAQALVNTTATITASPTAAVTATLATSDPILHRWVRQYPSPTGQTGWAAYEFKFYPDGSLVYNYGTPKMTSGNLEVVSTYEASGTWTKSVNNTYLLHYLPLGRTGAQIVKQYTWVPQTIDKEYSRTIPEHIVSQDEIDEYAHSARDQFADEMLYPERAKVD